MNVSTGILSIVGSFFAVGGVELSLADLSSLGLIAGGGAAVCWAFTKMCISVIC